MSFGHGQLIDSQVIRLSPGEKKRIILDKEVSSYCFRSADLAGLFLTNEEVKRSIEVNHHFENEIYKTSILTYRDYSSGYFELGSDRESEIEIVFLRVPRLDLTFYKGTQTDSCEIPSGIDQDIWRSGLSPPSVSPSLNTVSHCVIHHSAGSNSATDFTEVVRNIYTYHTQVNGWDDIGYNYLIAPDGTLYHGRDGMGAIDDDNVRGAHYCGKNSGTMGVCILGDFVFIPPQTNAINTLEDLLLWKINKENLNPTDSARHPLPGGAFLNTIVGHQDGCATACPGTFLYNLIPGIISNVEQRIQFCQPVGIEDQSKQSLQILMNAEELYIRSDCEGQLYLLDLLGRKILERTIEKGSNKIDFGHNTYPIMIYRFESEKNIQSGKLTAISSLQ